MKNERCPECTANGHDSNGDHLYLMSDGSRWCCNKVAYHDGNQYFFCPADPDTGEPVLDGVVGETSEVNSKQSSDDGDPLAAALNKGEPDASSASSGHVNLSDLPLAVDFRNIPGTVREKYGVRHECSEADMSVEKVYYPIYESGKQVAWKVRTVDGKKFTIMEVH